MKKLKCYLSILLVLSMMLCSTSMFTVNAAQVTETEDVVIDTEANLGGEDELQPSVASITATHNHHVYPQAFRSQFTQIFGSDVIDNYTVPLNCTHHLSISYQYNQEWASFLSGPLPSASATRAFAQELAGKYGYSWPSEWN